MADKTINQLISLAAPASGDEVAVWDADASTTKRTPFSAFATSAQGALADSALQDVTGESIKDLSDVYSAMTPADGQVLTYDTTNGWQAEAAAGGSGHTIQDAGSPMNARTNLNFVGAGVTVTDDAGNDQTDVTITSGGHTIQEDGTPLTNRTNLNFKGFSVTDVPGSDATLVDSGVVNVKSHGAVGDGVSDELAAFDAATTACPVGGTIFVPDGKYLFSDTWAVPGDKSISCGSEVELWAMDGTFAKDRPLLDFGAAAGTSDVWVLGGIRGFPALTSEATTTWTGTGIENFVGVRVQNVSNRVIEIGQIAKFYVGFQLLGSNDWYCGLNRIHLGTLRANRIGIHLKTDGDDSWVNGNEINYHDYALGLSAPAMTSCLLCVNRGGTSPSISNGISNNNIRGIYAEPSATYGEIAWWYAGTRNKVSVQGIEAFVTYHRVYATEGDVVNNVIETNRSVYIAAAEVPEVIPPASDPGNDWYDNTVRITGMHTCNGSVWSTGNMADGLYEVDGAGTARIHGLDCSHFNQYTISGETEPYSVNSAAWEVIVPDGDTLRSRRVDISWNRRFSFFVDTTYHKTFSLNFQVAEDVATSAWPRVGLEAYDDTGTLLGTGMGWKVTFNGDSGGTGTPTRWADLGPPSTGHRNFSVHDDVKYVRFFIYQSLYGVSVSVPENSIVTQELHVWNNYSKKGEPKRVSAPPETLGVYQYGERLYDTASAGGWYCSAAGTCARDWVLSTAYKVGQLVENDSGKIYVCVSAGTSAGSGGPTGTGTGIADNTVTWDHYGPKALFKRFEGSRLESSSQTSATHAVSAAENGTYYDNTGATAIVEFDLPAATRGLSFTFERVASYAVRVDPNGSETFAGSTAGKYKSLDGDGAYMKIECIKDGVWHVVASSGSVSDE